MGFHKDRDSEAFIVYKKLYTGMPWLLFDFNNLKYDTNGYYVVLKNKEELDKEGISDLGKYKEMVEKFSGILCLSGDTDFGMKFGNTFNMDEQAYSYAEQFFDATPEEMMHKSDNYSLLIVNTGLNCRKGLRNLYRDIFPQYVYALYLYYSMENDDLCKKIKFVKDKLGKPSLAFRPKKGMSLEEREGKKNELKKRYCETEIPALICYLDSFGSFENYFTQTYFWGCNSEETRSLLNSIRKFGKQVDINSFYEKENIEEYCHLAKQYWEMRNNIIEQKCNAITESKENL